MCRQDSLGAARITEWAAGTQMPPSKGPRMDECPICKSAQAHPYSTGADSLRLDCPRCGEFDLTGSLVPGLQHKLDAGIHRRALMSHSIRRMQRANAKPPVITTLTTSRPL